MKRVRKRETAIMRKKRCLRIHTEEDVIFKIDGEVELLLQIPSVVSIFLSFWTGQDAVSVHENHSSTIFH